MCGLAGIVRFDSMTSIQEVKKMTDAIIHRGPDNDGFWINAVQNVAFGHRRLAITDLTDLGKQPMISESGRFVITFNGEIYNYIELRQDLIKLGHSLKTENDTEVLLKLFELKGKDCLDDLDGMFAFAIWDNETNELFCARDRFGEKPFFYFLDDSFFAFGSEMKALWQIGVQKELNPIMTYNYEFFGYKTNPDNLRETFFKNVSSLPQGHYMILRNKQIELKKYYSLELLGQQRNVSTDYISEQLRALMTNSVKKRLRGQVNVGSSFSGGLDSSIIVSLIEKEQKFEKPLQTFSAIFPDYKKNEEHFIKLFLSEKNIRPHFVLPDYTAYKNCIEHLFYHHEEPFTSPSVIAQYYVYQEARKENNIVLLDGQGADEIFGGYHAYYSSYFQRLYRTDKKKWRNELKDYKTLNGENAINQTINGGLLKQVIAKHFPKLLDRRRQNTLEQQIEKDRFDFYKSNLKNKYQIKTDFNSLTEELHYQTFYFGLPTLLRYADRNSMANSVEVRLPFLDHKIVEFIFALPDEYKIHSGWTKWLLRETFKDILPEKICWRKEKIGLEPNLDLFSKLSHKQALEKFKQTIL